MSKLKPVLCNQCGGEGYIINAMKYAVNCPKCNGYGIVRVPFTNYDIHCCRKDMIAKLLSETNFYQIFIEPGPPPSREVCEVEILKWLNGPADVDAIEL